MGGKCDVLTYGENITVSVFVAGAKMFRPGITSISFRGKKN